MNEKKALFHVGNTCTVTKIFGKQGQYINKGQPVFEFSYYTGRCDIANAEDNCVLKNINIKENDKIFQGDTMYSYEPLERNEEFEKKAWEYRKPVIENTEFVKIIDDFTNDIYIKAHKIAGKENEFIETFIAENSSSLGVGFSLKTLNGNPYINIRSLDSVIRLNKNDELIFLFEDQIKINFVFSSRPSGGKSIHRNALPINFEILQTLLAKNFLKWKYIDNKTNEYVIGTFSADGGKTLGQYFSIMEGQYLLRFYTAKFIEANQALKNKDNPFIGDL